MAPISVEKKGISVHESDGNPKDNDAVPTDGSDNDRRFDQALDFLKQHKNDAAVSLSRQASFTRALRRRVDFRVIPFLCCCYTLNFLDKVLLNVRHSGNRPGDEICTSHSLTRPVREHRKQLIDKIYTLSRRYIPICSLCLEGLIGLRILRQAMATLRLTPAHIRMGLLSGCFDT